MALTAHRFQDGPQFKRVWAVLNAVVDGFNGGHGFTPFLTFRRGCGSMCGRPVSNQVMRR